MTREDLAGRIEPELTRFTDYVWTVVLSMTLRRGAAEAAGAARRARIDLTGAWNGCLELECDEGMAREAAARMFRRPAEGLSTEDVEDAVGELANMVGGHLKSLLPQPVSVSPPSEAREPAAGEEMVSDMGFSSDCGSLRVRVLRQKSPLTSPKT